MAAKRKKTQGESQSPPVLPTAPVVHEATVLPGGAVRKGNVITQTEAEMLRRDGQDIVVCGPNHAANMNLAREIEHNANGTYKRCPPHAWAGSNGLPHYQPDPRPPQAKPFMKRRTGMPSDPMMLFFTRELYRRYNSPDDAIALAADAEWEAAIGKYHEHLGKLQEKMPSPVIELSKLCLHDGEILQREEQQHPLSMGYPEEWSGPCRFWPFWYGLATLAVRMDDELVTLFYFLSDHMTEQPSAEDWPFSKQREHWLYDEIHWQRQPRGRFTHLILLSSGIVLTIPFATVAISRFTLSPASAERDKQSA